MSDNHIITGQPKDPDQIKHKLLQFINESLIGIDTFDYSEIPHIEHPQGRLPSLKNYFNDDNFIPAIKAFHEVSRGLLIDFKVFIENCSDAATLIRLEEGITSYTMDIRRFDNVDQENDAKKITHKTTLQYNPELSSEVARITSENMNIPELILQLKGNPEAVAAIKDMIMNSIEGFPVEVEGMIKVYLDFVQILKIIDTQIDPSRAVSIIVEFIVSVKYVSDFATNDHIKDTLSNIFNILANYFGAVELGQMYYQDANGEA